METRKETLSDLKVCRFCLTQSETLLPLYDNKTKTPKNTVPFALKILACISVEVFPSDKMPQYICQRCKLFMELSYTFKQLCRQADEAILQYIRHGSPLSPMVWPAPLNKVYKSCKKPEGVMKTVVQGGVKVMAEEVSDSEEGEDDNVYNVKIGEGSEDCKSIKIITSVNKKDKATGSKGRQEFASVSKLTRHLREHAGARSYPCKYCGKSFTKSHHYTRHVRLKHQTVMSAKPYHCDECDETFGSQDQLLYHSALHATKNLTCPLCHEKFGDVNAVTTHIKSHVNGSEHMCDFCELIFTSKNKLDAHVGLSHDHELLANEQETENDESSMDMEADEDDEDNSIKVKEENGHMVVEIKNTDEYLLPARSQGDDEDKTDQTQSEDSDVTNTDCLNIEMETMPESVNLDRLSKQVSITKIPAVVQQNSISKPITPGKSNATDQPATILMKVEEMKRKMAANLQSSITPEKSIAEKKESSSAATGANDKSLRLLEKELQDLKRTNTLIEAAKTPVRAVDTLKNRRPQIFSSTPKTSSRPIEKKDTPVPKQVPEKTVPVEKKPPERKIIKDTKELKEAKSNNNNVKEEKEIKEKVNDKGNDKENKEAVKEDKKDVREKETPKTIVKNGTSDNTSASVEETVRRSTRPSKVKDYAKMIRDNSHNSDDESDEDSKEEDSQSVEKEKTPDVSRRTPGRPRGINYKPTPSAAATPSAAGTPTAGASPTSTPTPRKRGRPRKGPKEPVPTKIKKDDLSEDDTDAEMPKEPVARVSPHNDTAQDAPKANEAANNTETKSLEANKLPLETNSNVVVSPSGQTLTKIPSKSLPPGVKPLPLPVNPRLAGSREVCEMQIGKKFVKVQKIVMTKAEVEAMAKKGLVEMKDGTMVLKQGIKLPVSDPMSLKSKLVGQTGSHTESPSKEINSRDAAI